METAAQLANHFKLTRNAAGRLQFITNDHKIHDGVFPVRAFPITAPDAGLSILSQEGHELAWVPCLDNLPADCQKLIVEELAQREFMPVIRRINHVSSFATPSTWEIETDRGTTSLTLKGEDQIWRIANGRLLITDKHGVNFLINEIRELDKHSRKLLDRFL